MIKNKKAIGNFTRISTYPGELCELLYCSRSTESPASKTLEALEQWKSREGGLNIQRFLPAHIWLTKSYERLYYDITIYITDQFRESMKKSTANRSAGERRN